MASAVRYFRSEVDAHYLRGECPARVCRPITLAAAATSRRRRVPVERHSDTRPAEAPA
jgi:hypothetical protein